EPVLEQFAIPEKPVRPLVLGPVGPAGRLAGSQGAVRAGLCRSGLPVADRSVCGAADRGFTLIPRSRPGVGGNWGAALGWLADRSGSANLGSASSPTAGAGAAAGFFRRAEGRCRSSGLEHRSLAG